MVFGSDMKKRYFLLILAFSSGCTSLNQPSRYHFSPDETNAVLFDGYYQPKELRYNLKDLNAQIGWNTSSSVGEQKMLVVPVQLKGEKPWSDKMLSNLNEAFFGDGSATAFASVSSFFHTSSYGNLSLSGEVTKPLISKYNALSLNARGDGAPEMIIKEFEDDRASSSFQDFDRDRDGYIDSTVFIYSNPYNKSAQGAFWAWCSYSNRQSNQDRPTVNNFMWASYDFVKMSYDDSYAAGKFETHTFIHETGHLLGLDDYYSYDSGFDCWDCAGKLDMQSYNIGDHNIYSKLALGWIRPYVVQDSCSITLRTSSAYPDAVLIKNDWNGSAFDEYLLMEYYTPTGLNQIDAEHSFEGNRMYRSPGLRVYHVDARMVEMSQTLTGNFILKNYSDYLKMNSRSIYYIGASNTVKNSYLSRPYNRLYRYLHLLDPKGENALNNGYGGILNEEEALWKEGDIFIPDETFFANGSRFNDESEIGYTFEISSADQLSCTLTIQKIE